MLEPPLPLEPLEPLEPPPDPVPVLDPPMPPPPPVVLPPPAPVAADPGVVVPPVVLPLAAWRDPPVPLVPGGALVLVDVVPLVLLGGAVVLGGLVVELGGLVVVGGCVVLVLGGELLVVVPWPIGAVLLGGVAGAWARLGGGSVTLGLVVGVPLVAGGAVEWGGVLVAVASAACLGAVSKPTTLPPIAPISTATRMLTHFRAAT